MLSKYNQIADQTSEEILAGLEAFEAIYQETFESTSAKPRFSPRRRSCRP